MDKVFGNGPRARSSTSLAFLHDRRTRSWGPDAVVPRSKRRSARIQSIFEQKLLANLQPPLGQGHGQAHYGDIEYDKRLADITTRTRITSKGRLYRREV